ncbi:MAG: hypothetical protein N2234_06810 [Planctomycetota bacterium]|nr:hypothetical protein [Planctomycetota bacterium]
MTKKETKKDRIIREALEILEEYHDGIRSSRLRDMLREKLPDVPVNTIEGTIWNLHETRSGEVYKPEKGLFRHIKFRGETGATPPPSPTKREREEREKEKKFYKPFADWLVNELEECTKAIPLGENIFRDKWGTPDVIGKRESAIDDIVKVPTEIVSAEIKADSKELVTAFGQACSYKLFSHKSYIVIPKNTAPEEIARVEALCLIFGIGLVLFDSDSPRDPKFEIRTRPLKHEPDNYYVNKCLKTEKVKKDLFGG